MVHPWGPALRRLAAGAGGQKWVERGRMDRPRKVYIIFVIRRTGWQRPLPKRPACQDPGNLLGTASRSALKGGSSKPEQNVSNSS